MTDRVVHFKAIGSVGLITLDRPGKLNALGSDTVTQLHEALDQIESDKAVKVIVVAGEGRGFCAGANISEFEKFEDADAFGVFLRDLVAVIDRLAKCPKPSIAAIHGMALGGGFELVLGCDLRIAAPDTKFGLPEVKLGILPGAAGTQRLARAVPNAVAKHMIMTGENISADRACELGLLNAVEGNPLEAAMVLADQLASGATLALAKAKELVDTGVEMSLDESVRFERRAVMHLYGSADGREGMSAFVEKRQAKFVGE